MMHKLNITKSVLSLILVLFIIPLGVIDAYADEKLVFKSIDSSMIEQTSDRSVDDISFEGYLTVAIIVMVAVFIMFIFVAGIISIAKSFSLALRR